MYIPIPPNKLLEAIEKAGVSNGRPRIVQAQILFDEAGNILTYIIDSHQLHRKAGADIKSLIGRVIMSMVDEPEPPKPKRRTKKKVDKE